MESFRFLSLSIFRPLFRIETSRVHLFRSVDVLFFIFCWFLSFASLLSLWNLVISVYILFHLVWRVSLVCVFDVVVPLAFTTRYFQFKTMLRFYARIQLWSKAFNLKFDRRTIGKILTLIQNEEKLLFSIPAIRCSRILMVSPHSNTDKIHDAIGYGIVFCVYLYCATVFSYSFFCFCFTLPFQSHTFTFRLTLTYRKCY